MYQRGIQAQNAKADALTASEEAELNAAWESEKE